MDKNKNLIPNSQRTHEELSEMGRKGGIASGKARRERRKREAGLRAIIRRCSYSEVIQALFEVEKERRNRTDEAR